MPLDQARPLDSIAALWRGYDPTAEPLDTEVLHEWEQEGVILRVVRFRLGVFKGKQAWLAGIYGYPKGGSKLPGLLQIHGGGQYADYRAPLYNAKRGYATLSIAWAGRINAPEYKVDSSGVKAFWTGDTKQPGYKKTTDWGGVDGYHAPRRSKIQAFDSDQPGPWTLDNAASPRNSGWFLCTVAARRGLTFLEKQPEVEADRLGVYGHSMGGKITVMTAAADKRVKAAAPSCGGISHRDSRHPLYRKTLGDDVCLKQISCPIIFLSPSNDFHGRIDDLPQAVNEIASKDWRVTCSPHLNHRDTGTFAGAAMLWFDQHLKKQFVMPRAPDAQLLLDNADGVPMLQFQPDVSLPIEKVEVYYTQQGKAKGQAEDFNNTRHRFWHYAEPKRNRQGYVARLPLSDLTKPLWVYANVTYRLPNKVAGAGYYYSAYETSRVTLSSVLKSAGPGALANAGCKVSLQPTPTIEDFTGNWRRQWFSHATQGWAIRTNKLNDPLWQAPIHAELLLEVRSSQANKLVVGIDGYAAQVDLPGGEDWQQIRMSPDDFKDARGQAMPNWAGLRQLRLVPAEHLRFRDNGKQTLRRVGGQWRGPDPQFRLIKWEKAAKDKGAKGTNSKQSLVQGDQALVNVFPPATFNAKQRGTFSIDAEFKPSPGPWMQGLEERDVFRVAMKHEQDALSSYELRMGVGGQIYSLQGAFGESVPPSWRGDGATSPWNDEVWQFVAVCSRYNQAGGPPDWLKQAAPYKTSYFVHNSGCYMKDAGPGVKLKNLYCPLLASGYNVEARSYRQVNWGMVPQTRSIHRSPVLFYTQVRDAGGGVIELTWVVHNFSTRDDVVFDYLNAPWGGTRVSSLPLNYVAKPGDGLMVDAPSENDAGPFYQATDVRNTGGFSLACAGEGDDSPSLAFVFGLDRHREAEAQRKRRGEDYIQHRPTRYRSWRANHPAYFRQWKDFKNIPANSFRNYQVATLNPHLYIRPQTSVWYRTYLVVGSKKRCAEIAASLVRHVDYGRLRFDEQNTPLVDFPAQPGQPRAMLYAHPVPGTLPVFKLRHKPTGNVVYTTDPYRFTPQQKLDLPVPKDHRDHDYFSQAVGYTVDGQTEFLGLLGYAKRAAPKDKTGWVRLSNITPAFRKGEPTQFDVDVWLKKGLPRDR